MVSKKILSLDRAVTFLESLEETIISKLIDRIQFCLNPSVYESGKSGFSGESSSLFELRMRYQEETDALFGRYTVPEERPYNTGLPAPQRSMNAANSPFKIADFNTVNLTPKIIQAYLELLPRICSAGSDGEYLSAVGSDIYAIQTIATRIHYGSFYVAECKYTTSPDTYRKMIDAKDTASIEAALTRPEVEQRNIARVMQKTERLQNLNNPDFSEKKQNGLRIILSSEEVGNFYRDVIMPLTREGEVRYLMNRQR